MKVKKIPQRTCTGCKTVRPKKELVRIVRTPEGEVMVDPTGKKSGRGAYICPKMDCLEQAVKKSVLDHALEITISAEAKERLCQELTKLVQ